MPLPDATDVTPLVAGEVQLWLFPLAANVAELETLTALLDADERARAARFRFERDRIGFIVTHAWVRHLLGALTGRTPRDLAIRQPPHEKPVLAGRNDIHFSLSHSGTIGMVGLATRPLGVDVEMLRAFEDRDAVTRRFFAPGEIAGLMALPEEARHEAFFACWTRKEAYVKAIGLGLANPLDAFEVAIAPGAPTLLAIEGDPARAARWSLWSARLGDAWAAAAIDAPAMSFRVVDRLRAGAGRSGDSSAPVA